MKKSKRKSRAQSKAIIVASLAPNGYCFDHGGELPPLLATKKVFLKNMSTLFDVCMAEKVSANITLFSDLEEERVNKPRRRGRR